MRVSVQIAKFILIVLLLAMAFFLIVALSGCGGEDPAEIARQVERLSAKRDQAIRALAEINDAMRQKLAEVDALEAREHAALEAAGKARFLLKIKVRQQHYSMDLDLGQMLRDEIKDSINAAEFWIGVDAATYDANAVGSKLCTEFRAGSFFFHGSVGTWDVSVVEKKIVGLEPAK